MNTSDTHSNPKSERKRTPHKLQSTTRFAWIGECNAFTDDVGLAENDSQPMPFALR